MARELKKVKLYTDGACSGNPGKGGWAAILLYEGTEKELSGYEAHTTNNRMELTAVIEGLKVLKYPCEVEVYSDSSYVVNAFKNNWISAWKANGWNKNSKEEVSNKDLWQQLDMLAGIHKITWIKVKGHGDNEYNNRCDRLATGEIKKNAEIQVEILEQGELEQGEQKMNYEEKTISEKHIYTGNIISVELVTVALPDGREATRDVVKHPGAAAVIALNEKGEMYMVRQYRKPLEAVSLEIPAGKLDPGEDPYICAQRELKEETGLTARNMIYMISIHSTPGFSNEILHIYVATGLDEGESNADADEFISTEKYTVDELLQMVMERKITDAKSIIGIFIADRIIRGKTEISYK